MVRRAEGDTRLIGDANGLVDRATEAHAALGTALGDLEAGKLTPATVWARKENQKILLREARVKPHAGYEKIALRYAPGLHALRASLRRAEEQG